MRAKSEFKAIPFALDRSRRGDLAAQIATGLRLAIETGYYKAGDILPPVRDLAPMLDVSKGIAEQALALVREEGLINPVLAWAAWFWIAGTGSGRGTLSWWCRPDAATRSTTWFM